MISTAFKVSVFDIEQFLTSHGCTFRRRGKKAELRVCPFCMGGTHNDLWTCVVYIEQDGGNYKCMRGSCGETGSFWQLLEHHGEDPRKFLEKQAWAPSQPSMPVGMHRLASTPTNFTFPPAPDAVEQSLTAEAEEYFQRRGLSPELQETAPVWCDDRGNVCFGYYHQGELCMVKVRVPRKRQEGEPKAWQAWKGGLRPLWCIERANPADGALVITFGEYDALALKQVGVPNVTSIPNGDNDLEWINICWDQIMQFESVILWADNDKSGQEAVQKIAERLGYDKLRVVRSPYKDANEHLVYRMAEVADEADLEIHQLVQNAEWLYQGNLFQLADVLDEAQCFEGYTSGIEPLDKALGGFFFGQLILHIGKTKQGKSSGVNQITAQAIEQGGKVCVWAGEDSPSDYRYKLYTHLAGWEGTTTAFSQRTGTEYPVVKPDWVPLLDEFVKDDLILLHTRELMTEEILLRNFELAYRRFGCDTFVVDNLMKLVAGKNADDKWQRQTIITNRLVDFAKHNKVIVHLVCHTNKSTNDTEAPTLRSNAGAQEIANLCDRAVSWWRVPEAQRHQHDGGSVIGVLADRTFGAEGQFDVTYHPFTKRYGTNTNELNRRYTIQSAVPEVYDDGRYGD